MKKDNIGRVARKVEFMSVSYYRARFVLSFLFLLLVLFSQYASNSPLSTFSLSTLSCFVFGSHILSSALSDIKRLRFTFNMLASICILCAILYSGLNLLFHLHTFGTVTKLFALPLFNICLINYVYSTFAQSTEVSKSFMNKMEDFMPKSARLIEGEKERRIFAAEIKRGNILYVKRGEVIPVDGFILKGRTELEETVITGNTELALKREGDNVYAGTINKTADIYIEASCLLSQSEISFVIQNLKHSETRKQLSYNPLDSYSRATGLLVVLGVAVFVGHGIFTAGVKGVETYVNIGLFVAAMCCPPAFIVSFTLSHKFGRRLAGRHMITLHNDAALKVFHNAQVIYFDKTGTLTNGVLSVSKIFPATPELKKELLKSAITAEQNLQDPYGLAVQKYCKENKIKPEKITSVEVFPGQGITVKTAKQTISIGNIDWFKEQKIEVLQMSDIPVNEILICVAKDGQFLGYITLADELREGAKETVDMLRANNKELVLVSGDSRKTVAFIAQALGGITAYPSILPEAKAAMIRKNKIDNKQTVMVGDGFNDILAMLEADCSVAFHSTATSAHANWVDVVIDRQDFYSVGLLLKLYNVISVNVLQNIVISFLCSLLLVVFLLRTPLTPWFIVMGFGLGGVVAVFINSVRLLKKRL